MCAEVAVLWASLPDLDGSASPVLTSTVKPRGAFTTDLASRSHSSNGRPLLSIKPMPSSFCITVSSSSRPPSHYPYPLYLSSSLYPWKWDTRPVEPLYLGFFCCYMSFIVSAPRVSAMTSPLSHSQTCQWSTEHNIQGVDNGLLIHTTLKSSDTFPFPTFTEQLRDKLLHLLSFPVYNSLILNSDILGNLHYINVALETGLCSQSNQYKTKHEQHNGGKWVLPAFKHFNCASQGHSAGYFDRAVFTGPIFTRLIIEKEPQSYLVNTHGGLGKHVHTSSPHTPPCPRTDHLCRQSTDVSSSVCRLSACLQLQTLIVTQSSVLNSSTSLHLPLKHTKQ